MPIIRILVTFHILMADIHNKQKAMHRLIISVRFKQSQGRTESGNKGQKDKTVKVHLGKVDLQIKLNQVFKNVLL